MNHNLAYLQWLYNDLHQGFLLTDHRGAELYCNAAFRKKVSWGGEFFYDALDPESRKKILKFYDQILRSVPLALSVKGFLSDKSEKVFLRLEASELLGEIRVKIFSELSEKSDELRQKLQQEIKKRHQYEEMLIQQSKLASLGEMMGMIAHQWRQPLNAFGLLVQDIAQSYQRKELSEAYLKKTVQKAMDQVLFMSKTMDDFRNFFKPAKTIENFDLRDAVRDVCFLMEPQLKKADIELSFLEANQQGEYRISGYQSQFRQVALNLIQNSLDVLLSLKKKQRDFKGKIEIHFFSDHLMTGFCIQDNGGGIPEKILDRIFDLYFTTKEGEDGTGIGLYLARMIIEERMGGTIRAENQSAGACFTIELKREKK